MTLTLKDDILHFYAKAIQRMQTKPITESTSWTYQAAIHDYVPNANDVSKGFVVQADAATITANTTTKRFWQACQHRSWYFLPWHRMYLSFFERIIMKNVVELKGPADWALPYWNYSGTSKFPALNATVSRLLPDTFQKKSPTLRDGTPNPLFLDVPRRDTNANDGNDFLTPDLVNTANALAQATFAAPAGTASFGGAVTKFNHTTQDPARAGGILEGTPHGVVHSTLGPGIDGFMGSFTKAPLDPIFWLHHCNIDRIWEIWRIKFPKGDPAQWTDPKKPDPENFLFHDENGSEQTMNSSQVMDTKAPPLSYEYDDTTTPLT